MATTTREALAYKRLRANGWPKKEARSRAAVFAAASAGPCECGDVRHLPGDNRCPASPTYTPPVTNEGVTRSMTCRACGHVNPYHPRFGCGKCGAKSE